MRRTPMSKDRETYYCFDGPLNRGQYTKDCLRVDNRQNEFRDRVGGILDRNGVCVINAPARSGLTTFLMDWKKDQDLRQADATGFWKNDEETWSVDEFCNRLAELSGLDLSKDDMEGEEIPILLIDDADAFFDKTTDGKAVFPDEVFDKLAEMVSGGKIKVVIGSCGYEESRQKWENRFGGDVIVDLPLWGNEQVSRATDLIGKTVSEEVISYIKDITGGHPALVQSICSQLRSREDVVSKVEIDDVDKVVNIMKGDKDWLNYFVRLVRMSSDIGERVPMLKDVVVLDYEKVANILTGMGLTFYDGAIWEIIRATRGEEGRVKRMCAMIPEFKGRDEEIICEGHISMAKNRIWDEDHEELI